jgi:diguanylate cyclase (GGDEF)-like protein
MPASARSFQTVAGYIRSHPFYWLVAAGAVLCATLVVSTSLILWQQHDAAIRNAGVNVQNLSRAVAGQTERVLASIDLAEDRLLDRMAVDHDGIAGNLIEMSRSRELQSIMRDITASVTGMCALILVDAQGNLVNFSYDAPIPNRSGANRAYFRFARDHPEVKSFIGELVTSRQTNTLSFPLVRRLNGADGSFKGLLLGAVETAYLERMFAASTLPPGTAVILVQEDGSVLVRHPAATDPLHANPAELRRAYLTADQGPMRRPGVFDDRERLVSFTRLHGYNLALGVTEPLTEILTPWRFESAWIGSIATIGCLASIITVLLAIRRFHDQRKLEAATLALQVSAERASAEQKIAEQHALFGMALDNMSQGLAMFDRSNRLLLVNAAVLKMYGLPPGLLQPGMLFSDLLRLVAPTGNLTTDVETVIEFYRSMLRNNVPARFVLKVPAGWHLSVMFKPYDTGWLVTYEDVTEVRKADERISHMALHDALTGLPNRILLRSRIDEALAAIEAGGFAVMCLDLDKFKDVNETLGHPAGDRLLCEVAKRIQSIARRSDVVARLGGDEFAVIAFAGDDEPGISGLAGRLLDAISQPYEIDGQSVVVGGSIGIALAPADGVTADTLMKKADLALYRAKSDGRGRFALFESAMEQHLVERRRLEIELRNAFVLGEFELYYQPVVKVKTRRIVACEALMRWRNESRGVVSPATFIPLAEETGLIIQMGEWALNRACLEAARWPAQIRVAVNLSPVQFRSGTLVEAVAAALDASGLAPDRLELEITESTMMQDTDATLAIIGEIKALGVRIAMDDFGTGYSSLAYLQRFPFDKVKIDQAFVRDIDQGTNRAIVGAVTHIAGNMGIETTAEGVETEAQFAMVAAEGCDQVQGYLFSPPHTAGEIATILDHENPPQAVFEERIADLVGSA